MSDTNITSSKEVTDINIPRFDEVIVRPDSVEFRQQTSAGMRIVQVHTSTFTPRVMAWTVHNRSGGHTTPSSMFLDEILWCAREAERRQIMDTPTLGLSRTESESDH